MEFLIPHHIHASPYVPLGPSKFNLQIKYMSIRKGAIYFVKDIRNQVDPIENRFLIVENHKNYTLRISIIDPKVAMKTRFVDWRDIEYEVDFKQFGKLYKLDFFSK